MKTPPSPYGFNGRPSPVQRRSAGDSKIGPVSLDQAVAQSPIPGTGVGSVDSKTDIQTFITSPPTNGEATILYNGDRIWARITLVLETAGPVVVGNKSGLFPVLSGKGILLITDEPVSFDIAKGTRLYIASESVNRVKFTTAPLPWLEMIAGLAAKIGGALPGKAP